jgi:hypothetical protein
MTTFSFPSITPSSTYWELVSNSKTFVSPMSNAVQTTSRRGSHWRVSMTFKDIQGDERSVLQAFLARLNGSEHRVTLPDHSWTRRGTGSDSTLVANGVYTGTSITCSGGPTSEANYAKAGDYIQIANALHMIVPNSDSASDSTYSTTAGVVTFKIAPPLRAATSNGTDVQLVDPKGTFILTSSSSWDTKPPVVSSFEINAMEDVLA